MINFGEKDCVYMRYPIFFLYYPKKIFRKRRDFMIILEHNTKEVEESKLISGFFSLSFIQEILFGKLIRSQSDALVGVTEEITQYQIKRCNDPNKPHKTIGNGINVSNIIMRKINIFISNDLHLLCVANVSKWHGLDRLMKGLATYQGPVKVTLHIAGDGADLSTLKKLAGNLNLSNQVIFHGFTAGAALDNLFNTCHIGVGSLGIHRKGLTQTS